MDGENGTQKLPDLRDYRQPQKKTFMQFNIDLWRRTRQPNNRKTEYKPSWMDKVEKTRQEIMNSLALKLRNPNDATSLPAVSPKGSIVSSPRSSASTHSRISAILTKNEKEGLFQHELLEKQYQHLRKQLFMKNEDVTKKNFVRFERATDTTGRKRQTPESSVSSTLNSKGKTVDSVAEYLQSDPIGSDHFFKHLQCVKQMARRYRRGRRRRYFARIVEVED